MIQIGTQLVHQNAQLPPGIEAGVRFRDISPDGYTWKKYGQKPQGRERQKSYFKCGHPGCPARRYVSYNRESGEMTSAYFGAHTHEQNVFVTIDAHSYEEYLVLVARLQQFEFSGRLTNGYGEPIEPIAQQIKPPVDFPTRVSAAPFEYEPPLRSEAKKCSVTINVMFTTRQDFEPPGKEINPLTDAHQELVADGFTFSKYGLKNAPAHATIYMRCPIPSCMCTKRIEKNEKRGFVTVTIDGRHNHPAFVMFNHEKYLVTFGGQFKFDNTQKLLLLVNNQKPTELCENYDYESRGVLSALAAYANTEERKDSLIDIYNLNASREVSSEGDQEEESEGQMKHLFPHI